jgi:alkylation response protein AidB-like acyl-CoA dehydrogenase
VANEALVLSGDELLLVEIEEARAPIPNLGCMPVADVTVSPEASVLASGHEAREIHDGAVDEWLVLTAAALVGIGHRALQLGVEYAKERHAWGVPIGSFQAISHPLADSATALDGARLLVHKAAWASDEQSDRARELAGMAFAFASDAARDATARSLHCHGGYGVMMEYDIQLYYRRARAWGRVFGDSARAFERVADARYGAVER